MAQIENDLMATMMADIGRRWLKVWDANINGDKVSPAMNLPLEKLIPEFIAREFTHFGIGKDEKPQELAYMMGVIMAAVGKTGTHSRATLDAAFKSQRAKAKSPSPDLISRWFSISKEWRKAIALALVWVLAVIAHSFLIYDDYSNYYFEFVADEWPMLAARALVPGLFGLAGFALFRALTK